MPELTESYLGQFKKYCEGYYGGEKYIVASTLEIGKTPIKFEHKGSQLLDSILAYDAAEVKDTYLGQINMSVVSSFSGPQGVLWGYDVARQNKYPVSDLLQTSTLKEFPGIEILNGCNLREASRSLFGTRNNPRFPLYPGSHVPCAAKYFTQKGPTHLYGASAVGVPEDRENNAILFMEDIGEIAEKNEEDLQLRKEKIMTDIVRSILEVGRNQNIEYKKIFIDFTDEKIERDFIGCVLVANPYFWLAQNAYTDKLHHQALEEWEQTIFE